MSGSPEVKTVIVEQSVWKQTELNDFVLDVFDLFVDRFVPPEDGLRTLWRQKFSEQMRNFNFYRGKLGNAKASLQLIGRGLTFEFHDFTLPVYRDEWDVLINLEGFPVEEPLHNEIFIRVLVDKFRGARDLFRQANLFFRELQEEGQSIMSILGFEIPEQRSHYGEIYAYLAPYEFETGVRRESIEALPLSLWAKQRYRMRSEV